MAKKRVRNKATENILHTKPKGITYTLPYFLRNNGDGSGSVVPTTSLEEAVRRCDAQDEGWGENSANSQEVIVTPDGKLYYEVELVVDEENSEYETVWVDMKAV